ncbi:MAG TPA: hypothetical protein VKH43_04005 [Thermoanaerobaculia bacterium]|nr:hypothetical protein [Thermoanaerobaculia bacterium]
MMVAAELRAQVTVAAGYTPPDDTPKINVGVTIFANYSYQDEPTVKDNSPQQNVIHQSSFDVTRAYINVTGSLSHWFSFRITPDIARETGTGSSLAGSQTFRLKYAYGQVNFDDFMPRGTWLRIGAQQTPYIDFYEGVYRYRFQGTIFVDREGFLTSSDYAVSSRVAFPDNYGDIHLGYYNGDGYSSTNDQRGLNNQKAFQVRGTLRPLPGLAIWRGIRLTGFYDTDHYYPDAKRERFVGAFTFEHPWVNAGFEWLDAHDRTTVTANELHRDGFSVFVTPRTPFGLEALIRYDELDQNHDVSPKPKKQRFIGGLAYWPALEGGKTVSFMVDYDETKFKNQTPLPAKVKIWAFHTLFNF